MIYIANKKRKLESIQKEYPGAFILDITSSSPYHYGQILSPFYPHGNIPIPGESHGMKATCVEAIWQGLKVFEGADIDIHMFRNDTMKNIKRTVRKYGRPLGHRFGVFSQTILNYPDARRYIYIPSYKYVLDNISEVHNVVERIKKQAEASDIVLLDYNLNPDNRDLSKPLSHAELVKMYIEGRYPTKNEDFIPLTSEERMVQSHRPYKDLLHRKKIETSDDEAVLIQQITEILQCGERSAKEICGLLAVDCPAQRIKRYINKIPGIIVHKVKNTNYYSLNNNKTPSLF